MIRNEVTPMLEVGQEFKVVQNKYGALSGILNTSSYYMFHIDFSKIHNIESIYYYGDPVKVVGVLRITKIKY